MLHAPKFQQRDTDDKQFVESIGLKFSSNEENFGTIRRMKDEF